MSKFFGLGALVWLMMALPAPGQQPSKASEEDIAKARADIRRLTEALDKLDDQMYEARRNLNRAYDRLDELEGRRSGDASRGRGRGGFGRDFGRRSSEPPAAPRAPAAAPAAEIWKSDWTN
jgi:hypothetical protein